MNDEHYFGKFTTLTRPPKCGGEKSLARRENPGQAENRARDGGNRTGDGSVEQACQPVTADCRARSQNRADGKHPA